MKRDFFINGQWVEPKIKNDYSVINPATEQVCATISLGGVADADAAVDAAKEAFSSWSQVSKEQRLALLESLLVEYKKRWSDMAAAISMEMGAPIDLAGVAQTGSGYSHIKGFIDAYRSFESETVLGDAANTEILIKEPIGVCALITPWNWPMNQVTLKVVPALAVGCTVVLKPSEVAPLSSIVFAEIIAAAGFPKGVFNLVNGDGPGVGSRLSSHPDVDMVSFTGSTRAGALITKAAADTVKRVTLELGGKGANIIFSDADDKAIERGVLHCFNNSGQSCNAPTRMLVHSSIYQQAVEIAKGVAEQVKVASPTLSGQHIGPVVNELQFEKIQGMIAAGIAEGATLEAGGLGRPEGLERGYYIKPTLFSGVNNTMRIAREEIFGPVLVMIPFETEEQAIAIANDSLYGLTHYLQTQDKQRAKRVARQLRSGMVRINGVDACAAAPFGGYKQSGNGREGGEWGLEDFLEIKHVTQWLDA